MNPQLKALGVEELRRGRAQSGVKTRRSVALGRDCWGWKAGVHRGDWRKVKLLAKLASAKSLSVLHSSLFSVLRLKWDVRERGNCLNDQWCQDKYIAPASGRQLTAVKGKGWLNHLLTKFYQTTPLIPSKIQEIYCSKPKAKPKQMQIEGHLSITRAVLEHQAQ